MRKTRRLTSSMEDYLESIRGLAKGRKVVRVRDIGKRQGVEMSSVTTALKVLADCGLVKHERYGYVELTPKGNSSARAVSGRHRILRRFLEEKLGVSPRAAEKDACKMEHAVSPQTIRKLIAFMKRSSK